MVLSLVCVTGCSKGDEGSYTIGEPTYADTGNGTDNSVPDPEGTITFSMANSGIRLGSNTAEQRGAGIGFANDGIWVAMTTSNNLFCQNCTIASIGKVAGLGDIKKIPSSGFASMIAIETGCGYVVKCNDGTYGRLYVVEWVISTSNAIIGAKVKYQYPFVP